MHMDLHVHMACLTRSGFRASTPFYLGPSFFPSCNRAWCENINFLEADSKPKLGHIVGSFHFIGQALSTPGFCYQPGHRPFTRPWAQSSYLSACLVIGGKRVLSSQFASRPKGLKGLRVLHLRGRGPRARVALSHNYLFKQ